MVGRWFGRICVVREGTVGLLYRDGVFREQVAPGRHRIGAREDIKTVSTRQQLLVVSGQEVLSADGFQPKLTAAASLTVVDAYLTESAHDAPYSAVLTLEIQLAIRTLAAAHTAEALARSDRETLDAALLAMVGPAAAALGVRLDALRLRDITLPPDLRRLLTGVEKARREGQAALERAHAEQAALRALANAARMLKNNPELQNLRLIQALAEGKGATVVLGSPSGLIPLREAGEASGR